MDNGIMESKKIKLILEVRNCWRQFLLYENNLSHWGGSFFKLHESTAAKRERLRKYGAIEKSTTAHGY